MRLEVAEEDVLFKSAARPFTTSHKASNVAAIAARRIFAWRLSGIPISCRVACQAGLSAVPLTPVENVAIDICHG